MYASLHKSLQKSTRTYTNLQNVYITNGGTTSISGASFFMNKRGSLIRIFSIIAKY